MPELEVRKPIPLRTLPNIDLSALGTWHASTGVTTFTPEDMVNAVAALECPGVRNPVIKLGHDEPDSTGGVRWDGEPAMGWIGNMRMEGAKIYGDLMGMPEWLVIQDDAGMSVLASAYPDRSIEIRRPFVCQIGHTHPSVITALALLGVYAPGVGVLTSMQDVYAAYTVAPTADIVVAASSQTLDQLGATLATTVRLAEAEDPREPNEQERRAGTDFAALQAAWQLTLDDLVEQWPEVAQAQRSDLSAQIAEAVDQDPDALGSLVVESSAAAALLRPAMRELAEGGAAAQIAEAVRQGVTGTWPEVDDEDVADVADAVAAAMAASTASTGGREAAQRLGTGTGPEIAAATVAYLAGLTDRFLRDQLGGALSAAQAIGRFKVLEVAPEGEYYASEINDTRSCQACKSIDGRKFDDLDEARAAYGGGKYVGCSGGARCRGTCIATWGTAAKAALSTTIRQGGPMGTESGVVQASVSVEDISRQYYESAGYSMWITAMHVDPLELIASDDATGKFYRIPVQTDGDSFTFGEATEVAINYVEVPVAAKALPHRWSDRKAALKAAGKAPDGTDLKTTGPTNVGTEPGTAPDGGAAIRKMAATATDTTTTPDGEPAAGSTTTPEEASVDAAKIREALGLAADAPDSEVQAKFAEALSGPGTSPTTTDKTDPAALLAAIPKGSGAIVLDSENYKTLCEKANLGVKAHEEVKRMSRDAFLKKAYSDGRFPVSKLGDYEKMWDNNPDATKSFIELMPKNAIPTQAVGFLGAEVDKNEADLAYEAMYGTGV